MCIIGTIKFIVVDKFDSLNFYLNILEKKPGFLVFSIGSKFSVEDLFRISVLANNAISSSLIKDFISLASSFRLALTLYKRDFSFVSSFFLL